MLKRIVGVLFILSILLFPTLLAPGQPVAAQSRGWSVPFEVSGAESSWFPDLTVGPDGSVHVIWASTKPREGQQYPWDLLMYRRLQNGAWSEVNDIFSTGAAGEVARTSIVAGRDARLHLLVRGGYRIDHLSAPHDRAWSALNWSEPRLISNRRIVYYDDLAIDSQDRLHAVWTENTEPDPNHPETVNKRCPFCSDLFYRYSSDGGVNWSELIDLAQMPDGSDRPHIAVDTRDRVHVVWDEGRDRFGNSAPRIGAYRRSDDGGDTWSTLVQFSLPEDTVEQTTVGLAGDGNPVVVFRATNSDAVYFQSSSDGGDTWSAATLLPGVRARPLNDTPYDGYTMASDGAGNVHLIMVGYLPGDSLFNAPRLLHLVWNSRSWSAPEVVVANNLYPEWPSLVVSDSNQLHLAWFTRNPDDRYFSDDAHYRVWYSTRTIDAPAVTPLSLFTPTPMPTPTPTPPSGKPTAYPTLSPELAAYTNPTQQPNLDANATFLLVLGGAPVVVLAAAVWIVRRVRQ